MATFWVSGSSAMMAESIHSVADIFNQVGHRCLLCNTQQCLYTSGCLLGQRQCSASQPAHAHMNSGAPANLPRSPFSRGAYLCLHCGLTKGGGACLGGKLALQHGNVQQLMPCCCALQVLLRMGIVRSKRAPSAMHPYGYMKDKFVWSLISAVGIFCLGAGVTVMHGLQSMFLEKQIEHVAATAAGEGNGSHGTLLSTL